MTENAAEHSVPMSHISSRALPGLNSDLLVQAECHRASAATELVGTHGVGIVYSVGPLRRAHAKPDSAGAIHHTRKHAPKADILIDASLYTGKGRKLASAPPQRDWITFQHHHDLPWALTDSGYCAAGDHHGLATTLKAGAALGPGVITALPIAGTWLTEDASTLKDLIDKHSAPVAVMVEDEKDPFDQPGAVAGLVEILRADSPVLLLRSDAAAVGALAHGAAGAAVGTTSTYRHIYPLRDGGGGANHLSFLIPALLGYFLNTRFENAYRLDPSLAAWTCECTYCAGRDLTWIASDPHPPDAAFQHSVAALADIGHALSAAVSTGQSAASAWTQMCLYAQLEHFAVGEATDGLWIPKDSLAQWIKLAPSTVGV
ncbi:MULTISPECIES: hypothetical protein [unclassified Mycobacterium]|uniref:hypothetical protein n=1 Tax=unclassified Mycobacterium TaxID=2642494 RepID=UPI0029C88C54|nr:MULTISPECIES: hypothetical protein [unclassified Mycobacterium]